MEKKVRAKKAGFQLSVMVFALCCGLLFAATSYAQGPCAGDIATFCKDVQPGGGRILQCLQANQTSLSPACQVRIARAEKRMAMRKNRPCAGDAAKFCSDVAPGGGRIINCLKQHESELSSACLQRLSSK